MNFFTQDLQDIFAFKEERQKVSTLFEKGTTSYTEKVAAFFPRLAEDLKSLDKYPWTGHSAILGRRKNPLMSEIRDQKTAVGNLRTPNQKQRNLYPVKFTAMKSEVYPV